ncbi:MAG: signal recognition particle protein, partial [Microbacteriaceae bacterium]|nr:signal recognition particle protein [Microbacteriaceae bacterium]
LTVVAEQAGVQIFAPEPGNGKGNPVTVAKDGVKFATQKQFDTVIIDTAGRLGVDEDLMREARAVRDATSPDEVLFVLDAMIGQDAVLTAKAFQDGVDFTGVVLTKLDGDARGGAALSVRGLTDRPIVFASTGEDLDAIEPFYPDRMASRILDLGDILTLIEQAQKNFDDDEAAKVAEKLQSNTFTLSDFLEQLQQVRKMGSMKGLLGMMPGAGKMREQIDNFDEKDIDRTEAIIRSMTPLERDNPKLLNGSRRLRIAKGSGMTVTEVNQLVIRFEAAAKMMKTVARGGTPNIPGMGPIPGGRVKAKTPVVKKGSRSGNPAKRAAENAALLSAPATDGNSFGIGSAPDAEVSDSEMETMRRFIERGGL